MNLLEQHMKDGEYQKATLLLPKIKKFYSSLCQEDREYIECTEMAIKEGIEWNVPEYEPPTVDECEIKQLSTQETFEVILREIVYRVTKTKHDGQGDIQWHVFRQGVMGDFIHLQDDEGERITALTLEYLERED